MHPALAYSTLTEQRVLKSKKSFDRIIYKNSEAVSSEEWFPKKSGRDDRARMQYRYMIRLSRALYCNVEDLLE